MKNIKFNKKRIIFGGILLLIAVLCGFLLDGFLGPESAMWQRMVWIVAVLGTGLSGIMCSFMGALGVVYGYGFVLILSLPRMLPDPWNRYFSFVYLAALLALPVIRRQKNARKNREPEAEPVASTEEQVPQENAEGGLLVYHKLSGRFYQLIRTTGEIRAYFVGNGLKGVDDKLLQNPAESLRAQTKKDLIIPVEEITKVRFQELPVNNTGIDHQFVVKAKKKHVFCAYGTDDLSGYMKFFHQWLSEATEEEEEELLPEKQLGILQKIHLFSKVYLAIVSLCWLFLNVPYMLFSLLELLVVPVFLVLYVLFPDSMTILEKTKSTKKISIIGVAFISAAVLLYRTFLDYDILKWRNLLVISLISFAVCTVLLLLLTKEWKKKKLAIVYIMLLLMLYLPSVISQINCTFDLSEPREQITQVEDLSVSTSSKSPDQYYVHVSLRDGSQVEVRTSKEHFDSLRVGDWVGVYIFDGTLGIPYAYVW